MIAHANVTQFPDHEASVIWGEWSLPGTSTYENTKPSQTEWHFSFRNLPDLPENLVAGNEMIYLKHFYDRLAQNPAAFSMQDLEFYTTQYSAPGALRCGFNVDRAFETDAEHNRQWLKADGKVKTRAMILSGEESFIAAEAEDMANEMYNNVKHEVIQGSGDWLAEENPKDFVQKVLAFVEA